VTQFLQEQVKATNTKRKNLKGEGSSFPIGFDSESLAKVFGRDKGNGNLRGFSFCLSEKCVMQARLTAAVLENTSSNCNTSVKGVKRVCSNQPKVKASPVEFSNRELGYYEAIMEWLIDKIDRQM
ncbi:hypothetical protein MKX01_011418, partial [Papaver californicum]